MYPVSVLVGKSHVMDATSKYEITGTYSVSPAAFAAALASLDVLEEEKISERSQRPGDTARKVGALRPGEVWLSEPVRIGYGSVHHLPFQKIIW